MVAKRGPPNRAKGAASRGNDQPIDEHVRSPPSKKVQPQNQEAAEEEVDSLSRRMAAIDPDNADASADAAIGNPDPPTPSPGPEAMDMEEHVVPPPQPPPGAGPDAPTTSPSGAGAAPPPDETTAQDLLVIQIKHGSVARGGSIADELMTKLKDLTGYPDDVFDLFSTKESQYYVGDRAIEMEWGDVLDLLQDIVPSSFILNGADNGLEFMYNQQTAKVFGLDHPGQPFPISILLSNTEELSRVTNIPAAPAKQSDFNVFKVIVEGAPAPDAFGSAIYVRTIDAANFLTDNLKTHARTPNGEQVGLQVLKIDRKKHKALGTTDDSTRTYVWYADVAAWRLDTSCDPLVVQFPEQDRPKKHILSTVPEHFNFAWRLHPPEKSERRGPRGAWAASPDSPLVAGRLTVLIARPSAAGTPFPATMNDHNGERDKFIGDFKSPLFPTPSLARHADTTQAFAVETRDNEHLQRLFTAIGNPNIDLAIKGEWTRFPHPTTPHATVAAGSYMATIVSVTSPIICHKCSGVFQWAFEDGVIAARIKALPAACNTAALDFKPKTCGCYAASNKARKRNQQQKHDRSQGQAMGQARREARKAAKTGEGSSSAHSARAP